MISYPAIKATRSIWYPVIIDEEQKDGIGTGNEFINFDWLLDIYRFKEKKLLTREIELN